MGEMAERLVNGEDCSWCGIPFTEAHGYGVVCKECWAEFQKEHPGVTEHELTNMIGLQKAIYDLVE